MKKLLLLILFILNLVLLQAQEVKFISVNQADTTLENITFKRLPKFLEKDCITTDTLAKPAKWMVKLQKKLSKQQRQDSNIYIFFCNNLQDSVTAYLPLSGKYGYVLFDTGKTSVVELEKVQKRLSTHNYQWDLIHDPETILLGFMQNEEEGAYIDPAYLTMESITLGELPSNTDNDFICFTPAGELITIFDGVTSLNFATRFDDKVADGALTAFKNSKGNYVGLYNFKENKFLGYALVVNPEASDSKDKVRNAEGKITFYDEEATASDTIPASLVYLGYRKNCAIEFHTIMFSEAGSKPTGKQKGDGDLASLNDLTFTSSKFLKTLTDDDACQLPNLNLTELGLRENTQEAVFNPYGKGGLLMMLKIGERTEYIYQNADYEAEDYFYRWDDAKDMWVEWTPQTPQELTSIDIFLAIFEIWNYLLVENPHEFLDAIGMIPVIGEPVDVINGLWYLAEGETVEAGLSFISIIPIAGDYVGKSIRYVRRIGKI